MRQFKKNIVILGKLPPPFIGPAMATQIMLKSKLRQEFEIYHLDTSDHRDINTLGKIDFQNIFLAFKQYCKLVWLLVSQKPEIVYLPNKQTTIGFLQDLPIMIITKLFRKKLVCHLRGGDFLNWYNSLPAFMKWVVRKAYSFVDAQIVLGRNLKYIFAGIVVDEKIHVVPNGANFVFSSAGKNGAAESLKILYLANFHRSKGVLDVLYAIPHIYQESKSVEFTFAGSWRDEETKEEFERFMRRNRGLPIRVLGPVSGERKMKLYSESDVFVFPSYYPPEGHPWVIVEATAAGLAIIATDHGAIAESVIDGKNGFIVEKKNPKQISERIIFLSRNRKVVREMGKESRRRYEENYTEDMMVERLKNCFNSVL